MQSIYSLLGLALCLSSVITLGLCTATGNEVGGGGGGWHGEDEYENTSSPYFPKESINPDEEQQKRLVVQWGKASMGSEEYDADADDWLWKDNDSLHEGRGLRICGRLLIESLDKETLEPIDWLQGVRIIVSRLPDKKHNWSKRQEDHDAVWDEAIITENGEFWVTFSPGDLLRSVGKESQFQVALSLGLKSDQWIRWENTWGVLPQSVSMLSVPGPPPISETMQIINGAPSYDQRNFNPAKLIRAVNHLMPMGKEKAIGELREFMKIACGEGHGDETRVDENIDTSDNTCVFLIVRLLFEPVDTTEKYPSIGTVPFTPIPEKQDALMWPLHPVYLQDDIPIFLVYGGGMGGLPQHPIEHVEWAEKHGKIRTIPYRPLDNPMLAAQRMVALPQTQRLFADEVFSDFKVMFYKQAWNIIVDADPAIAKPLPHPHANADDEVDWDERAKAAVSLNIHWSEAEQRYIMP